MGSGPGWRPRRLRLPGDAGRTNSAGIAAATAAESGQSGTVPEVWRIDGEVVDASSFEVDLRARLSADRLTTWIESSEGRTLALVSNGARMMVVLMEHVEDPGLHAIDPLADSQSQSGYVLDNGQVDTYSNRDTVPLDEGVRAAAEIVRTGELAQRITWQSDR